MLNDLSAILADAEDQERGAWCDLLDPVTGRATGIRFRVAGPDSRTQAKARLALSDELAEAADADGRVSAEAREKARLNSLARCVLAWEIEEDGKPVPFSHANVVRVLRAATWVQAQVDAFAADRRTHRRTR
ncbi:hypothetical protein LV780_09495 [Cereibacter azotoformans]|uniref:hypothetical protein n=1 Tax=Cereibacter azotoformans TaxID=43057 RepID=UPI000E359041|nr:hypothetical protein [Cereibacter azotoformans]AXQ94010.1 hypothetical protein D0Z66_09520 [Cereibacter sphaeroides]UIJ29535.1 hypothetical protein LV780_09495 [Cereibacter azotoformans]